MRAVEIVAPGEPVRAVELPDPVAGPDEVVVRIQAAGICRSDVHYRAGTRPVPSLPLVPGHEVAGVVAQVGSAVTDRSVGDRVALHYLVTCGDCPQCSRGAEQFCESGAMLGLDRQGGYAESIVVPARNARPVPDAVSIEAAAVMMCSTATSLHALRRGEVDAGDAVAVFGAGGLGMSAIQLALALGADPVFAVDLNPVKLELAAELGATPVDGRGNVAAAIREAHGDGVDVALELVGSARLMPTLIASLAPGGRAVAVGITHEEFGLDPYRDLIAIEADIRGVADHLVTEVDELLAWAGDGVIEIERFVTGRVPLDAESVEAALRDLEAFGDHVRYVILPG